MIAHMAQSSARWRASQTAVIIQALAPVIGPYMSRAITAIHTQETIGSRTSSTTTGVRSYRRADSRSVGVRFWGAAVPSIEGSIPDNILVRQVASLRSLREITQRMAIPRRLNKTYWINRHQVVSARLSKRRSVS